MRISQVIAQGKPIVLSDKVGKSIRGIGITKEIRHVRHSILVGERIGSVGIFAFAVAHIHIREIPPYRKGFLIEIAQGKITAQRKYLAMVLAGSCSCAGYIANDIVLNIAQGKASFR